MTTPSATVTYLHADNIDIQFDLYVPPNAEGSLPAVVYFHGGGLLTGSRRDLLFPVDWSAEVLKQNIIFISADYRLLIPQTSFAQIEDVKALFAVLSDTSALKAHLPPNVTLKSSRIAVSGTSAGGYMARVAALYATPKPVAVWSLYGMGGDFFLDHWIAPHDEGIPFMGLTTKHEEVAHLLDIVPPVEADVPIKLINGGVSDKSGRFPLFNWFYATGEFVDKVTGILGLSSTLRALPHAERAPAVPKDVEAVFPQLKLTKDFPPTLLTHGDADTVVPLAESELTHRQLTALAVQSYLTIVPNSEHGLNVPGPAIPAVRAPGAQEALSAGVSFMVKFLHA